MVGLALSPIIIISHVFWILVLTRAILLSIAWGLLNKYLPQRLFIWDREAFLLLNWKQIWYSISCILQRTRKMTRIN